MPDTLDSLRHDLDALRTRLSTYGAASIGHNREHGVDVHRPRSNFSATTAPAVTDDFVKHYGPGSIWVDVTADKAYVCADGATGAAVWHQIDITSLAGFTGGNWKALYTNGSGAYSEIALGAAATYYRSAGASSAPTFSALLKADLPVIKATHILVFAPKGQDLVVSEDWAPLNSIKLPTSGEHGTYAALRVRVRCVTAGTGTNTIKVQTSTTRGGSRTEVASVSLGTSNEPSDVTSFTGSWVPASDEYVWVQASAVGATAPKDVTLELYISEAVW